MNAPKIENYTTVKFVFPEDEPIYWIMQQVPQRGDLIWFPEMVGFRFRVTQVTWAGFAHEVIIDLEVVTPTCVTQGSVIEVSARDGG
jgi:hypothetical protein